MNTKDKHTQRPKTHNHWIFVIFPNSTKSYTIFCSFLIINEKINFFRLYFLQIFYLHVCLCIKLNIANLCATQYLQTCYKYHTMKDIIIFLIEIFWIRYLTALSLELNDLLIKTKPRWKKKKKFKNKIILDLYAPHTEMITFIMITIVIQMINNFINMNPLV